jgi:hypothetical protein
MKADPNERITEHGGRGGPPMIPIIAGLVVVIALAVWLFSGSETVEPEAPPVVQATAPAAEPDPEPEPELPPAPDIPPAPAPPPAPSPEPEPAPPPAITLDTSDEALRETLEPVLSPALMPALETSNLLERGTAVIDGLSRGALQYKLLPLAPPAGKFQTRKTAGQDFMNPAGYARYDAYAEAIEDLDTEVLVAAFHRFRPLMEEAYGYLGYEPDGFDNALIRGLDNIIAAPVIEETIPVTKVEAVYKYADASLEKLPAVQKQLLRMGPENTRRIQRQARALRAVLLASPEGADPRP